MDFSIVICTHNGAQRLPLTLNSLQQLAVPEGVAGEIVFVDNDSTDDTQSMLGQFSSVSPLPVTVGFEPRRGLSNARNAGIALAQGRIIAFTDDDCIVSTNWIDQILAEFAKDVDLMILGGRVELYNALDRPVTLRQSKERLAFTSAQQVFTLLPGCNMAFRRSVVDCIGEFDANFGAGKPIPSAEDSDFFYRGYRANLKLAFFPNILIYHNHGRRTDLQVKQLMRGYVIGQGAFYCKHILRGDRAIRRLLVNEIKRHVKAMIYHLCSVKRVTQHMNRLHDLATGFILQWMLSHGSPTNRSDIG